MEVLSDLRLSLAKQSFSTRRVDLSQIRTLFTGAHCPGAGDLVLARVDTIGHHTTIELKTGRKALLFVGDEVILSYGNRYAPDQFEAHVPDSLAQCDMVAGGGIAAHVIASHERVRPATRITPLGLLGGLHGRPINVADFALPSLPPQLNRPIIVVCGTSMNAGKTSAMASLVRGLSSASFKVGTIKATGTGAGNDLWIMRDAGATEVLDFTDAGWATTHRVPVEEIERSTRHLIASAEAAGCNVIIVEVADGLLQAETRGLMSRPSFRSCVSGVIFAAGDAMGALAGERKLISMGYDLVAISGRVTQSPLACREVGTELDVPLYGLSDLSRPEIARDILDQVAISAPETAVVA